MIYDSVIKPLLFTMDPESAHHFIKACARICNNKCIEKLVAACYRVEDERLRVSAAGLSWKNPIGLAAGFDKDAEMVSLLAALGFSHLELGTVTSEPQPGNDRPRIFRLPRDSALINRMGFPSSGAAMMQERLARIFASRNGDPILGVNIGKSKSVELQDAVADYLTTFGQVAAHADYVAVNVSSPNTQGLRQLQAKEKLGELLMRMQSANTLGKPIFVKLAPDLTDPELDDALECCEAANVAGVIATNTTVSRPTLVDGDTISVLGKPLAAETGGLSGSPLRNISPILVKKVAARVGAKMTVVGVGGISTVHDVIVMLQAGATLIQIYTALVYNGPGVVARLNQELVSVCDRLSLRSVSELKQAESSEIASILGSLRYN